MWIFNISLIDINVSLWHGFMDREDNQRAKLRLNWLLASGFWFLVKKENQYELFSSNQQPVARNIITLTLIVLRET